MGRFRKDRIAELLRAFLSTEIINLRDPRLQSVTITAVEVTNDCRHATIFWSVFNSPSLADPEDDAIKQVAEGLRKALPLFRKRIGEELDLRFVPELHFRFDDSLLKGARIEALLDRVRVVSEEHE